MNVFQGFRTSAVLAGAFFYAVSLSSCAGGTGTQSSTGQGTVPAVAQSGAAQPYWAFGHHHFAGEWLRSLNLTEAQRAKLKDLMTAFRQAHPRGSTVDPQARKQLHQQMFAVLTPQQQSQLRANFQQMHGAFKSLNLSQAQRDRIHALVLAYRQAHPRGSDFDPQARRQLREEIMAVLTPQQRAKLEQMHRSHWSS